MRKRYLASVRKHAPGVAVQAVAGAAEPGLAEGAAHLGGDGLADAQIGRHLGARGAVGIVDKAVDAGLKAVEHANKTAELADPGAAEHLRPRGGQGMAV